MSIDMAEALWLVALACSSPHAYTHDPTLADFPLKPPNMSSVTHLPTHAAACFSLMLAHLR
eukprot:10169158-Alexandrium_andersonii.AAC.1